MMKKNGISSVSSSSFIKKFLNRIKNSLKKPSKKTFGKIGLFLIFGLMFLNLNLAQDRKVGLVLETPRVEAGIIGEIGCRAWWDTQAEVDACIKRVNTGTDTVYSPDLGMAGMETPKGESMSYNPFKWLLWGVLQALDTLLTFSAKLLDFVSTTTFVRDTLASDKVYTAWAVVRDILNMFFMLLLLFSAFATIFQVEKYHLRKVIIMLVVMALLVNFSYPITLFIIDFSNSAMFFLKESAVGPNGMISSNIAKITNFGTVLNSSITEGSEVRILVLYVIFYFILFITIFSIALNFLIRMLMFVILVIVSPAGFAFAFFPGTRNIADDWWSNLFKYAFMGPVMMFFLYLSIFIFTLSSSIDYSAIKNQGIDDAFVTLIIPTTFLWIGLIASQKFGGAASGAAMNFAKKTGNNIKTYGQKAAWGTAGLVGKGVDTATGHRISGGIGGLKTKWDSFGENYKSKSNTRKTEAAAFLGVDGANEKLVREKMKSMKDEGVSNAELTRLETGTNAERMAVALFRAENNRFDADPALALTQYTNAMNAVRGHAVYENQFLGNARKTNIDLVINESIAHNNATTPAAIQPIIRNELERLDPDQWRDQNIQRMVANTTPNRGIIIAEGANVISGYSQQGQDNVTRNMRGAKLNAGSQSRNSGVGFWA